MVEKQETCPECNGQQTYIDIESGHGCDGTDEVCSMVCPVPVQVEKLCNTCGGVGVVYTNDTKSTSVIDVEEVIRKLELEILGDKEKWHAGRYNAVKSILSSLPTQKKRSTEQIKVAVDKIIVDTPVNRLPYENFAIKLIRKLGLLSE